MAKEPMVSLIWPNGHIGACRKSMADRFIKRKSAKLFVVKSAAGADKPRVTAEKAKGKKD